MAKISKRSVDALAAGGSSPVYLWDDLLAGFGVKALPTGAKRYFVKYRTFGGGRSARQRWLILGTHGQLTPDTARKLAQQALAAVARGEDPQAAKLQRRAAPKLQDVWDRFEAEILLSKKAATQKEYSSQWYNIIRPKFGRSAVDAITRSEIERFHRSMRETPYRANRVLALLSRLLSLAEGWELRPQGRNPCKHIERFRERSRTRSLSLDEIQRVGLALRHLVERGSIQPTAAHAIELLLLTGARLNEILSAEWAWVMWDKSLIALPDSKTGEKSIFLSEAAMLLLRRQQALRIDSPFLFPSPATKKHLVNLRKTWVKVCEQANIPDVRLHDLRHTAASIAVGQGASLTIVGRLLGHTQAQTTLKYSHVDAEPALRVANVVGDLIGKALTDEDKKANIESEREATAST